MTGQSQVRSEIHEPPVVFLYSGHGGQAFHMGRSIYEKDAKFRLHMNLVDAMLEQRLGSSVIDRIYSEKLGKSDAFDDFRYTHPAIFMVQYALSRCLIEASAPPALVVGASLGELVAATISGSLDLEDAVDLISHHVEVFGNPSGAGGMLAVFERPDFFARAPELSGSLDLSAIVDETNFVVSGRSADLDAAERYLETSGVTCLRLPVNLPFHSRWIDKYRPAVTDYYDWSSAGPTIPFMSCATQKLVSGYTRAHAWSVLREPLHIREVLEALSASGNWTFIDLGPASAMAAALRRTRAIPSSRIFSVLSVYGDELKNYRRAQGALAPQRKEEASR